MLAFWVGGAARPAGAVVPPLLPEQLAELYGGNTFARGRKKKELPPLAVMVEEIAAIDGGKEELIDALPKRAQQAFPEPDEATIAALTACVQAASEAVKARVRKIYELEVLIQQEEDDDDDLLLMAFQ